MSATPSCPNCGAPVSPGARFCANCGTSLAPPSAEERKLATILFADVIGSTDLGEQLDPERLRALLQEYFVAMAGVVEAWGGSVEKYIGDAILAVWGVPTAREDDPERALHAAIEMLAELESLNAGFERRHGVRLAARIGVNSGEVLAPVGMKPAGQFIVSGDPVNVAARLEQAAEPGTVLVGERTWSSARHAFRFDPPTALTVKGKREAVTARRLREPISGEQRGVAFQAPMLGRDRELGTLLGLLDEAMETGLPRLVLVVGPAGIGKSRLLREFIGATAGRADLVVLRGRCLAAGHGITFWALGEVLRAACGISLDEPADSAAEKLTRRAAGPLAAVGLSERDIVDTISALATSANLAFPGNALEGLDPEAVAEEMGRAWPRFLTGLAAAAPLAMVVEDVHWADGRMLRMLELLTGRSHGPLLLIATARPEFTEAHPGFAGGEDLSVVSLRPLTEAQTERLVVELLGTSELPAELVSNIRRKADGNPFFLEEILQRLIDEGALVPADGRWQATERAATVELPDTVHAVLAARIDALPPDEKRLIQEAAVVGRVFWPGPLVPVVGGGDVSETFRSLERRGLIAVRPSSTIESEPEYLFRHVLIRDVAYASVPKTRRARAHAETGRWIEELAGDRLEEFGELIAYHYATAVTAEDADLAWADHRSEREEVRRRAFEMLIRAGASARHRFAVDKALELHGQALALATSDAEALRAREELGDDHEALFHGDEAVSEYLAAIELARRTGDEAETIGRLASKAGRMAERWGAFREPPPIERIEALIDESLRRELGDRVRAALLIERGGISRALRSRRAPPRPEELPELPARIASVEEGLAIARRLDDADLLYLGYDVLDVLHWRAGQYDRSRDAVERKGELLDRLVSRRQQVDVLVSIASARSDAGDYAGALEAAEEAFARAAQLSPHERMHAGWALMWAAEALGRWDRILEILPWHVEAASAERDVTCAAVRGGPLLGAAILVRRGDAEQAQDLVPVEAEAKAHSSGTFVADALAARYAVLLGRQDTASGIADRIRDDPESGPRGHGVVPFLEALWRLGRLEDVETFLAVARQESDAAAIVGPVTDRTEAILALARGRPADAKSLLVAALERFEVLSVPFEAAQTRELLASIVLGAERAMLLRAALEAYETLGARPDAERIRAALETPAAVS